MLFIVALAAAVQVSCSGGGSPPNRPIAAAPTGSVVLFGGDAPLCNILSFAVTITGITLTPQGGGSPVSVLSSGNSLTLDFASLMDFVTLLNVSNVPPGTYTQVSVTLANPQLTFLDTSKTPPAITVISPTLSTLVATLDLTPAVVVTSNTTVGLQVDFDLLKSVQVDSHGQMTGNVSPTFTANLASPSGASGFAEFEDLRGIVQSVQTSSTNPSFAGAFAIQPATGQVLNINVTSSTTFDGVSSLANLTTGTFVEVDAFVDSKGNLVAKEVQAEEVEDAPNGKAAFSGLITAVTRDAGGNATQFALFVREENPDVSARVPLRSVLNVNLLPATRFVIAARGTNFAGFGYSPGALGVGQHVVVHGELSSTVAGTSDARSVFLGLQSVLGNLDTSPATPPVIGTDGKTGGFTLLPCSPVFVSHPVTVLTSANTAFVGVSNLTGLTSSQPLLLVKGLMFYEQTTGMVNSQAWVPPANVQVAKQVHELP
jgi:hypothetical protein